MSMLGGYLASPVLSGAARRAVGRRRAGPNESAEVAVRDYRRAVQLLIAEHERTSARVIHHLLEIPLVRTRREDALRLIEYMPPLTAAGRRREAAKDIWALRRRYGSKNARRRLRAMARAVEVPEGR